MQTLRLIASLWLAGLSLSRAELPSFDQIDIGGKTYKSVQVTRVDPAGFTFTHEGGARWASFEDAAPEIQTAFNYDPKAARAFVLQQRMRKSVRQGVTQRSSPSVTQPQPSRTELPGPLEQLRRVAPDSLANLVVLISYGWTSDRETKKADTQKEVLFKDQTGLGAKYFFDAVAHLNSAFGYDKLEPGISTAQTPDPGVILIYLGDRKDAKEFLRIATDQTPSVGGTWDGWFWWDESKAMNRAAIAVYREAISDATLEYHLTKALLCSLGYPGSLPTNVGTIFDAASPTPRVTQSETQFGVLNLIDVAVLRFCDRNIPADSNRAEILKICRSKWGAFLDQLERELELSPALSPVGSSK